MEFERARTKEQKDVRISEILGSAIKQYQKNPYENITLASISKDLSFSRVNLYKYFKTKEEIFLKIVELDLYKWIDKLKLIFMGQPSKDVENFAKKWAASIYSQKMMLGLMTKQFSDLEKNSSVEKLAEFKSSYFPLYETLQEILKEQLPMLNDAQLNNFVTTSLLYAMGLYPTTIMCENQIKAIEMVGVDYKSPNFVDALTRFCVIYIKGLTAK